LIRGVGSYTEIPENGGAGFNFSDAQYRKGFFVPGKGVNPLYFKNRVQKMAKQTGPNPFIGRRGNLQGYRMAGKHYVRIVSSLTGERVKKDPAFKHTMQCAGLLGQASRVASAIYRRLPAKEHGFYRKLTGMAMELLKQGKTGEESLKQLEREFIPATVPVNLPGRKPVANTIFADELLKGLFSRPEEQEIANLRQNETFSYPMRFGPPG